MEDGFNGLYYHDGVGTYTNANQEAGDYSYRYSGNNPNNYVCFGSTTSPCPTDNLYRIIGVFNGQVKLIKNDSIGDYAWDTTGQYGTNEWSSSNIRSYINNWFNYQIDDLWTNIVSNNYWQVGGVSILYGNDIPKTIYNYELGSNSNSLKDYGKVGLMYVSDYAYAASPENWMVELNILDYNNTVRRSNWLYLYSQTSYYEDYVEWTITPVSSSANGCYSYEILSGSIHDGINVGESRTRPTFYLNSNVELDSGSGTQSDPYRLAI